MPAGRGVLLAVSGGADSVSLLAASARIAGRIGLRLRAATIDHGLRPESRAEADRVHAFSESLGVPHVVAPVQTALALGENLEAWARRERYAALEAIRVSVGVDAIATAHTASDQAETVLMRLTRGAALGGASAILERRGAVLRPMLFATRADVLAYVAARTLPVEDDAMNHDPGFLRVRMREDVMPVIEQAAGPHASRALARFATLAAEDDAYLESRAAVAFERVLLPDGSLELESVVALDAPIARRVIARWLVGQSVDVDANLIAEVWRAAQVRTATPLPNDRVLDTSEQRLTVRPAPARLHGNSS